MVFKVDRVPAFTRDTRLTCRERLLEFRKLPRNHLRPAFFIFILDEDMRKLEQHGEHAIFTDPVGQFRDADAICLTDGKDIVPVKDLSAEFMEKV